MLNNEFRRPVSVDSAPRGSSCEWCGKPAEHQLIAIGGEYHNESGLFCKPCGEQFSLAIIARSTRNNATTNQPFV
jgi:hypothetical protein